ncbi:O-antigen ligase family protein [Kocuria sp. CPCC 205258]|uniref:O-antigen ligase family protein n=1 Tax=Kocuria sp. CPCC 205258 TaxID=3073552 RepID=UPI0034D5131D
MSVLTSPSEAQTPTRLAPLPGWPLLVLLYGFPVIWAAGALQFAPSVLAAVMVVLLLVRRNVVVPGPLWVFAAFLLWAAATSVMVPDLGAGIGFLLRWANLFSAFVFMVYYFNAREAIGHRSVLRGAIVVWVTLVVLGHLALVLPDARLTTPIGLLLPDAVTSNQLVQNLVFPPLAEVQQPWGAPERYIRPAAPFPYTNGWGSAFVVLTPLVLAYLTSTRFGFRSVLLLVGLGASLVPAVATSNRGMFIGITVAAMYVIVRWFLQGRLLPGAAALVVVSGTAAYLVANGSVAAILGRQEYSDSTGGRASLYQATFEAALKSPFLGYGAPRMEESVGVSMGTQGYLWTLLFCFGFVGLGLFMAFLHGTTLLTARVRTSPALFVHSVPVAACVFFAYYGIDVVQFIVICLCLAMIMRARTYGEDW